MASPHAGGPGTRYDLGISNSSQAPGEAPGELPAHYEQTVLSVVRRDPDCLLVSWSMAAGTQRRCNHESQHGHMVVRAMNGAADRPCVEAHVHPESNHWFLHVERSLQCSHVELGYYNRAGTWCPVADRVLPESGPAQTGTTTRTLKFVSIPGDVPLHHFTRTPKGSPKHSTGEAPAPGKNQPHEEAAPPFIARKEPPFIGNDCADADSVETSLPAIFAIEAIRKFERGAWPRVVIHQHPVVESTTALTLSSHPLTGGPSSAEFKQSDLVPNSPFARTGIMGLSLPELGQPTGSWSSASLSRVPPQCDIPLEVEVDLVIRGATAKDAHVEVEGNPMVLDPQGRFELHMALHEGAREFNISAAADHGAWRNTALSFQRETLVTSGHKQQR